MAMLIPMAFGDMLKVRLCLCLVNRGQWTLPPDQSQQQPPQHPLWSGTQIKLATNQKHNILSGPEQKL